MLLLSMIAALSAEPAQTPSVLLEGLAGSCFQGDIPQDVTDTHCFTVSEGGMLGLDVHKVRSKDGTVVYEGVTAYRPEAGSGNAIYQQLANGHIDNAGSGTVTFGYYNSLGDLMTGAAVLDGDDLHITVQMPDGPADVTWHITGDGYDVANSGQPGQTHFTKIGPVPEGGL